MYLTGIIMYSNVQNVSRVAMDGVILWYMNNNIKHILQLKIYGTGESVVENRDGSNCLPKLRNN